MLFSKERMCIFWHILFCSAFFLVLPFKRLPPLWCFHFPLWKHHIHTTGTEPHLYVMKLLLCLLLLLLLFINVVIVLTTTTGKICYLPFWAFMCYFLFVFFGGWISDIPIISLFKLTYGVICTRMFYLTVVQSIWFIFFFTFLFNYNNGAYFNWIR